MTLVAATENAIADAARALRDGQLVAFPTETVYGLGADATNDKAVAAIFEAKGRPRFNPLIVHLESMEKAFELGEFDEVSLKLAEAFWPGALTLVVRRKDDTTLSSLASAGLDTVALRVPASDTAHQLIKQTGRPLAAPSANRSGSVSPTTAAHVHAELGDAVALILDDGPCTKGIESSVVTVGDGGATLLRAGALTRAELEAVTGPLSTDDAPERPRSPGQLERHYAPRHRLRLDALHVEAGEALLSFGEPIAGDPIAMRNLSPSSDLTEAAAHFFAYLRELDETEATCIAVMAIPDSGLGEAINDRLRRGAR